MVGFNLTKEINGLVELELPSVVAGILSQSTKRFCYKFLIMYSNGDIYDNYHPEIFESLLKKINLFESKNQLKNCFNRINFDEGYTPADLIKQISNYGTSEFAKKVQTS